MEKGKSWTEAEKEYLRQNYRYDNIDACAEHLGRTRQAIMEKAYRLKIKSGRYLTSSEKEYLDRFQSKSNQMLMKALGRNNASVRKMRKTHDIGSIRDCRCGEYVLSEIGEMMCKHKSTISKIWVKRRGLKAKKVGKRFVFVKEKDLIQFLKDNPTLWDATKVDDTLFSRYKWFQEKKKSDFDKMVQKRWKDVI